MRALMAGLDGGEAASPARVEGPGALHRPVCPLGRVPMRSTGSGAGGPGPVVTRSIGPRPAPRQGTIQTPSPAPSPSPPFGQWACRAMDAHRRHITRQMLPNPGNRSVS